MVKLFVYGTLKHNFYNHHVIEKSGGKLLGYGVTEPKFTMFSLGGYPGVSFGGDTEIAGEVYEVENLQHTDWLEGYPEYYNRSVTTIKMKDGKEELATIYYINGDINHHGIIEEGVWQYEF